MEGTGAKGTNGTKKGDCTNVHSERTVNWLYIKGEEEGKEVVARANNNTYLKQVHNTNRVHQTKQYNNKYTKQARRIQ